MTGPARDGVSSLRVRLAPSAPRVARLCQVLDGMVERAVTPGGVAAIAFEDGVAWEHAFGLRALVPEPEPASLDTLYDLASLTKPLVTAAEMIAARDEGRASFDQPVTDWVPEMKPRAGDPRAPTLGELLAHAGGLPAWKPLYAIAPGGLSERAAWLARHRDEPGMRAVYGCPGYQVLGLALERMHGADLASVATRGVLRGLEDVRLGGVPAADRARTAPTEEGNACERAMAGELAAAHGSFREGIIRGEVHDHNAFTLGGLAGNAGLFATARATALMCAAVLRGERGDLRDLSSDHAPHPAGPPETDGEMRSWGWQLARSRNSPAGDAVDDLAFGHAGFTGTSVLVDPSRRAAYVLLTNRIHPRWTDIPFHAERRRFHEAAAAAVADLRG